MEWEEPDEPIVARARAGDERAFGLLVDRYYAECLRYAYRMLGDRTDAEEAVQDAMLRAHRSLGRYEERQRFRVWLLRILANRCRSIARKRAWRLQRLHWFQALTPAREHAQTRTADWETELQRALAALPPILREAFLLKHVEELSYEEMKLITGSSESALKMRVKRACSALEEQLRDAR